MYHVTRASPGSTPRARYTFLRRGQVPTVWAEHFDVSRPQGINELLTLSNKHIQIWSSSDDGLLQVRFVKMKLPADLFCNICLELKDLFFISQRLRLQSGLVRQVQVQFLWYGTRTGAKVDKSGAYLFLPGEDGAQVRPGTGTRFRLTHFPRFTLTHCLCSST